jgi:3-hydroxybutyryl-CoA dehydrogenase
MSAGLRAAVIGGGTMGGSIATYFLRGGWSVDVVSPSPATRDSLPRRIAANLGHPRPPEGLAVHPSLDEMPWSEVDLVIESVTEDLAVKRAVFAELERRAKPDTPLTSNSSGLPISRIAEGLADRSRAMGLHHFLPAHLVPLVEIVTLPETQRAAVERLKSRLEELGKVPIVCTRDIPGFVANRIQHALMREALHLIAEGVVSADDVDLAVRFGFGFRYAAAGPVLQKELSGWDVNCQAAEAIYPSLCNDVAPNRLVVDLVRRGATGVKAREGFWKWTDAEVEQENRRYTAALEQALAIVRRDRPARPLALEERP